MEKVSVLLTPEQANVVRHLLEADDENTFQFIWLLDSISPQEMDTTCGTAPVDMLIQQGNRFVFDAHGKEAVKRITKLIDLIVENDGIVSDSMWGEVFPDLKPYVELTQ